MTMINDVEVLEVKPDFDFNVLKPSELLEEAEKATKSTKENIGIFKVKKASKWIEEAKSLPPQRMLFGPLIHEGELNMLFADTNVGKTILSIQLGNNISKGRNTLGLANECGKQKVIYCDFEMNSKQLEKRYSEEVNKTLTNHYVFDPNFIRVEINSDAEIPEGSFEDAINNSIEQTVLQTDAKIVIIDNITFLRSSTETAKDALPLMKHLKKLKSKYNLTIIILGHTPKRDRSKALSINDLQGSKMVSNFIDSCFAIGACHQDKHIRYIKQLKARNTEVVFDSENVLVCQIVKETNFLKFEFLNFGSENTYLKEFTSSERDNKIERVKELIKEGYSQRAISKELEISLGAVNKYSKL